MFEILVVIAFIGLTIKFFGLAFRITWGAAKIVASLLFALATGSYDMHDFCGRPCLAAPHCSCGSCYWYAPFGTMNNLGSKGLYC